MNVSKVYFVSAGPGAADLITVRGMQLLQKADIVFYDALVSPEMLTYCPQAIAVAVGKRCGEHSWKQSEINTALLDAVKQYPIVVRLKGGDGMVFGRADEELTTLREAGVAFEIVPGVTSALAASAYLQKPLTKRGQARSVLLATKAQALTSDASIVAHADTEVYYMGRGQLIELSCNLLNHKPANTPAVLVFAVSTPQVSHIHTTLEKLSKSEVTLNAMQQLQPCLLLVGEVFEN